MKVSFIIPAYNEENLIADCLSSILAEVDRSGVDSEIVVVNNASTDHTTDVVARFPRVRLIDEPRKGVSFARATGMKETNGELIAAIDADMQIPPGWLTKAVTEFTKHPKLVALSGPYIYYDLTAFERFLIAFFYEGAFLLHLFNQYILHVGAMLQGGNIVLRRSAFEAVGGFDTRIAFYGDDTDIACRLAKVGTVKWTRRFNSLSSGRRLRREGIVRMSWRYTINHLWVIWFNKPFTTTYTDVRPNKKA